LSRSRRRSFGDPAGARVSQLQWMNFPLAWQGLPSGLISLEPSPVPLYRLPWLSQHPPALQVLNGIGGGAVLGDGGCVACP